MLNEGVEKMLNPQDIFNANSLRQASVSKKLNILLFDYYYQNAVKILKSARFQVLSELYLRNMYIMIQK